MNFFTFKLSQEEEPLQKWHQLAIEQCETWNPLPGSPGEIREQCYHFFYPGSIRGIAIVGMEENEYSLAVGPFSSEDDIAKITILLELAHSLGVQVRVRESFAELSDPTPPPSLLRLLFPIQNTAPLDGEFHDLATIEENFRQVMKTSAWHNYQETDGEDVVWIDIVDDTFSTKLDEPTLELPQGELETCLIRRVSEVMESEAPVVIRDYSQIWRPALGMIVVSDYDGEACYISVNCSHVALHTLDPRFSGKLIQLRDLYGITKDKARVLGVSFFIPSLMGADKQEWFAKLEELAVEIPALG